MSGPCLASRFSLHRTRNRTQDPPPPAYGALQHHVCVLAVPGWRDMPPQGVSFAADGGEVRRWTPLVRDAVGSSPLLPLLDKRPSYVPALQGGAPTGTVRVRLGACTSYVPLPCPRETVEAMTPTKLLRLLRTMPCFNAYFGERLLDGITRVHVLKGPLTTPGGCRRGDGQSRQRAGQFHRHRRNCACCQHGAGPLPSRRHSTP